MQLQGLLHRAKRTGVPVSELPVGGCLCVGSLLSGPLFQELKGDRAVVYLAGTGSLVYTLWLMKRYTVHCNMLADSDRLMDCLSFLCQLMFLNIAILQETLK